MFTDMVGSTARVADSPAASADGIRQELFTLLRNAVDDRGGTEVKNLGDGLMVTFPSASSGVEAAVLTQQRVARRNRRSSDPIHVRVGLSAGDAVSEAGDWFGRPPVEAARLCDQAAAGQVLASEAIRLLCDSGAAPFQSIGMVELKGFSAATHAYEVLWEEADSAEVPLPLPPLLEATRTRGFAGREAEKASLASVIQAADEGARQVILISGEPGIGKTAIATDVAVAAHKRGMVVLYGRCEEDATVPYEPFVAALDHFIALAPEAFLKHHTADHGVELARIVPRMRARISGAPEPRSSDPTTQRYEMFEAVVGLFVAAARDTPLLVLLDDLHWAEHSTIQLLRHLVGQLGTAPVVLIGIYRGGELSDGHPLAGLLAGLHRDHGVTRIELDGLDAPSVVALMEVLAGHELDSRSEQLAALIHRETLGNPFFIREYLRNLRETGELQLAKGRWSSDPAVVLPTSVREVILRRVGRLGSYTLQVLGLGSIIGRQFDAELLLRALAADEDELAEALDGAVRARLLRELPGSQRQFEFPHALVEYTLYDNIGPARRRRGHHRVAVALEQLCGSQTDARAAELAYHFGKSASGADVQKALAYATRAGDRALAQLAPEEGVGWYEQALRLHAEDPAASDEERCELLIRLGQAQALAGLSQQRETLLEASELARRLSDRARLVRSALANERGRVYSSPGQVDDQRVEVLEDAIAAVGPADSCERAELLARLSNELEFAGDPDRRLALSNEALEVVRRIDAPESLIGVVADRAMAIFSPDTLDVRRDEAEEAVRAAGAVADPLARYHALRCRFLTAICSGDVARARDDLAEARGLARRTAHPVARWFTSIMSCTMSALLGRLEEADAFAEEGFEFATRSGQPDAAFVRYSQLAPIRHDQARMEELRPVFEVLARELPGVPACLGVLTLAERETGMQREACEHLHTAAAVGFAPMDVAWGAAVGTYAFAAAGLDHREAAGALYPLLAPYESQVAYCAANAWLPIAHHLGALARVTGRLEIAERHLWVAAQLSERMGSPIWLARTQVEQARVRVLRGATVADVEPMLAAAHETAARLGAHGLERDAAAALNEPESVPS
jgi:class 3 adenylate cyclase